MPCSTASQRPLAAAHNAEGDRLLDAGCRDATHLIELARLHAGDVDQLLDHVERVLTDAGR